MPNVLYCTKSVCPHCLRELPASLKERDGQIVLEKNCPDHGHFRTVVWRDKAENYLRWLAYGGLAPDALPSTPEDAMTYPLADDKAASPQCSAALMVTGRCNNGCPICFTRDAAEPLYEPDYNELLNLLRRHAKTASGSPLEFCGGEPTIRDDLPRLAEAARELGFDFIQVNTNGIRLAEEPDYCAALVRNGVTTAYLGFDGFHPESYIRKYGRNLLDIKKRAVANCSEAGLAVVLVCCVIPGGNEAELGEIVRFAKDNAPTVKGVFFQPLSFFGSYPDTEKQRLTTPDILQALSRQTNGEVSPEHFLPGRCEHPQCSFGAFYQLGRDNRLYSMTRFQPGERAENAHLRVRESIKRTWKPGPQRTLTIGGMVFMDAWNLDAVRLSRCTVQIIGRNGGLMPLCGKYLTSARGQRLHPNIS